MGILDGVDGKIARLRMRKTRIGKLEHSFDMFYEQLWYVSYIWYLFASTRQEFYIVLGLIWLVSDSYVRHIYNVFWLTTGKSLKYYEGLPSKVTKVDGRRSVYILHMIIWYLALDVKFAIYTILLHSVLTALVYTYLSLKLLNKVGGV